MRRGMRVSVRVAPMLLFLGACGADGHTLTEIRERGVFSICADPDALPYSTRAGAPEGLEIDLARILVDRLGVRLDIDWVALRRAARRVNCDAIMGSAELTDDENDDTRKSPPVRCYASR
jgi:polar amino acid transport system substrate-binding protein